MVPKYSLTFSKTWHTASFGVSRVSFGPGMLGLTLAHLQTAATQLTALGEYPPELGFKY